MNVGGNSMSIVASGQISIVDLNDSKQLMLYIGSSQARSVVYAPDGGTYNPNYTTTNQVLTPQLFIAGTSTDIASQAKSVKWFYQTNGGGAITEVVNDSNHAIGTTGAKALTIKGNVLSTNNSMTYICEIVYTDTGKGFDVPTKAEIELVKITNGSKGSSGSNAII